MDFRRHGAKPRALATFVCVRACGCVMCLYGSSHKANAREKGAHWVSAVFFQLLALLVAVEQEALKVATRIDDLSTDLDLRAAHRHVVENTRVVVQATTRLRQKGDLGVLATRNFAASDVDVAHQRS